MTGRLEPNKQRKYTPKLAQNTLLTWQAGKPIHMKKSFPEYFPLSKCDVDDAWKSAIIVLDSNILLNLYRYTDSARKGILEILDKVSGRLWIPHQVALEFHRNRITLIVDQQKRADDLAKGINDAKSALANCTKGKKSQQLVDLDPLKAEFERIAQPFVEAINAATNSLLKPTDTDPTLERLATLFEDKVGPPKTQQSDLDSVFREGNERYARKIPPGFNDNAKDAASFRHAGLDYQLKYGDLLIWNQILSYANEKEIVSLIFVTDDAKDDWWAVIDFQGSKILGPRPELVEEARRIGGIQTFLLLGSDQFVKQANKRFNTGVTEETLQEIKDVAESSSSASTGSDQMLRMAFQIAGGDVRAMFQASLLSEFGEVGLDRDGLFFVETPNGSQAYYVLQKPYVYYEELSDVAAMGIHICSKHGCSKFSVVFVLGNPDELPIIVAPDNLRPQIWPPSVHAMAGLFPPEQISFKCIYDKPLFLAFSDFRTSSNVNFLKK